MSPKFFHDTFHELLNQYSAVLSILSVAESGILIVG